MASRDFGKDNRYRTRPQHDARSSVDEWTGEDTAADGGSPQDEGRYGAAFRGDEELSRDEGRGRQRNGGSRGSMPDAPEYGGENTDRAGGRDGRRSGQTPARGGSGFGATFGEPYSPRTRGEGAPYEGGDYEEWSRSRGLYGSSEYGGQVNRAQTERGARPAGSSESRGMGAKQSPHAGKGPKGWQRSDDRIADEINEALARDGDLDASDIEVEVKNCEVTLTGTVSEKSAKRMAEEIAESVFGVSDVQNSIRVKRNGGGDRTGGDHTSGERTSGDRTGAGRTQEGAEKSRKNAPATSGPSSH